MQGPRQMCQAGLETLLVFIALACLNPHTSAALLMQGARQVREAGLNALFVFIAPPSDQELEKRLRGRGTESEEQIQQRMANAKAEISRQAARPPSPCHAPLHMPHHMPS